MFYQLEHLGGANLFKRETGKNFNFPLHLHQSFELIYLEEGEMRVSINESSYLLHSGEAVLIFPNQIHSIQSQRSKHTLFIFSPHLIQSFFADKNGKLPKDNLFAIPKDLITALKALSSQSSKYELKGALYTICGLFDVSRAYYNVTLSKENTLFQILFYIEEHFKSACTIYKIAEHTALHPDYLSRLFKQKMGISCKTYVNLRRLSYATYLLTNSGETCLSCALDSGFTSLRSFNRNFKKAFGVSPIQYKTQLNP